ncbi:phosphatidylinositol transfer protein csr1 [Paecilomyces lecythidis]|uniref:Phosphatidylinositol transfer protein csr1 n=1 Tax=Paecilomyces lecythidis TaxID=3004212 RepID=A0ABR3YCV2_9EURO
MDYQPVKFIIKCFEANFPESLGFILIHEAPWIFNSIWKIIRGWLDPVVAAKVNFTYGVGDLEKFIARENIIKELGGDDPWEYKYLEVQPGENERMKDNAKRDEVLAKASTHHQELQDATKEWIVAANKGDQEAVKTWKAKREEIIEKVKEVYWELDPYIRARSYYDRAGVILPGGEIDFYPERKGKDAAAKETAVEPVTETVTEKVAEGVVAGANTTAAVAAN